MANPDEETPLLRAGSKAPSPWGQISLALLSQITASLSLTYISPFINQFIGELDIAGGDYRKIGYYTGLIDSLLALTQALTAWQWSRLSDFIGRRPVILFGLLGLSLSNFSFGLSRTLATLIVSRCLAGILNGNIGVMRSMLGDITDHANMAQAFSFIPAAFSLGATVGPLYGGLLAKPQDRWPNIFRGEFWETYPYFLPSFVSGGFTLLSFWGCAVFMKETLSSETGEVPDDSVIESALDGPPTNGTQPTSMLDLVKTYSVMIPIACYTTLRFVVNTIFALLPLFYSAPVEIGGLGFPPSTIGMLLAVFGAMDGCIQALLGAKMIKQFGAKRLFCWTVLSFYPLILLFPVMGAIVTAQGNVGPIVWILAVVQLVFLAFFDLSFSVVYLFVTRAAPNKQSLGATNGLSESLSCIAHAIAPASVTSLFATSKEYNLLGGNLVYVVLAVLAAILVVLTRRLPDLKGADKDA